MLTMKPTDPRLSTESTRDAGLALIESIGDVVEAGVDVVMQSGFISELPVIKSVSGLYRAGASIREGLFVRKLQDFLRAASRASGPTTQERHEALRHFAGPGHQKRLGDTMMLLLDRADDLRKPKLLGVIIGTLLRGDITYRDAMSMSATVDRLVFDDLETLQLVHEHGYNESKVGNKSEKVLALSLGALPRLQSLGLATVAVIDTQGPQIDLVNHSAITPAGEQLLEFHRVATEV